MKETWRWFGQFDAISLDEIAQTGAEGIVTALHDVPYGEVWPREEIARRRAMIEAAGFTWDVVESLPVHEDIKRGEGDLSALFANYRQSLANLAHHDGLLQFHAPAGLDAHRSGCPGGPGRNLPEVFRAQDGRL